MLANLVTFVGALFYPQEKNKEIKNSMIFLLSFLPFIQHQQKKKQLQATPSNQRNPS